MEALGVLASEKCNLPICNGRGVNHLVNAYPLYNGTRWDFEAHTVRKRVELNLATVPDLRAAYFIHYEGIGNLSNKGQMFRVKTNTATVHIFEPSNEPLSNQEVKGHMAFAIDRIQVGETDATVRVKRLNKQFITNRNEVREHFDQLTDDDYFYAVLIFRDMAYAGGNYFDVSSLCNIFIDHKNCLLYTSPSPRD